MSVNDLYVSLCSSLVQRQSRGKPYDLHYFQQGGLSRSGTLVIQLQEIFLRDAGARKDHVQLSNSGEIQFVGIQYEA